MDKRPLNEIKRLACLLSGSEDGSGRANGSKTDHCLTKWSIALALPASALKSKHIS